MNTFKFQLVTPEKTALSEELVSLRCPTRMGEITILPNHAPLIAQLVAGELVAINNSGKESMLHVAGGFIEIKPHNEVIALADSAEHFYEIDEARAQNAIQRAQKIMKETKLSSEEYALAAASLDRSLSRLKVSRKHSHRRTAGITGQGILEE
jgi:F-type H+-transporting ATPase subunit epsilon